jgi:hypothetical protein
MATQAAVMASDAAGISNTTADISPVEEPLAAPTQPAAVEQALEANRDAIAQSGSDNSKTHNVNTFVHPPGMRACHGSRAPETPVTLTGQHKGAVGAYLSSSHAVKVPAPCCAGHAAPTPSLNTNAAHTHTLTRPHTTHQQSATSLLTPMSSRWPSRTGWSWLTGPTLMI